MTLPKTKQAKIVELSKEKGAARIARDLGCSESTVKRYLQKLTH